MTDRRGLSRRPLPAATATATAAHPYAAHRPEAAHVEVAPRRKRGSNTHQPDASRLDCSVG